MKEIEAKILEVNPSEIQKLLIGLGAQKVFEGDITWVVFDFPDGSLSNKEVLVRLRSKGEQTELTLKQLINTDQAKVSEETELIVDDFKTAKKFLEGIGLTQKRGYPLKKHRISYLLNGVHFEIDTFSDFPTYLEIEAPSDAIIKDYATKLGFLTNQLKPWGTRELFAHYRKARL